MNFWFNILAVVGLFTLPFTTDAGRCEDLLDENNHLNVTSSDGSNVAVLTDCAVLVSDFLFLCKMPTARKSCCASCQDKDYSCADSLAMIKTEQTGSLSCSEFVSQYPCMCKAQWKVRKTCCKSCEEQGDLSWCDCRDVLSASLTQNVSIPFKHGDEIMKQVITFDSCQTVVDNFDYLCANFGGNNNLCCESCKDKCVDSRSFKVTVRAIYGKRMKRCTLCTCAQIAAMGENHVNEACKRGKVQKNCCAMCSQP